MQVSAAACSWRIELNRTVSPSVATDASTSLFTSGRSARSASPTPMAVRTFERKRAEGKTKQNSAVRS